MSSVDISQVIEDIREEAAKMRQQPPHPDRKRIKAKKIQICPSRPSAIARAWTALKRERIGFFRRIFTLPLIGYLLKWLVNILRLPVRLNQLYTGQDLGNSRLFRLEALMNQYADQTIKSFDTLSREIDVVRESKDSEIKTAIETLEQAIKKFEKTEKELRSNLTLVAEKYSKAQAQLDQLKNLPTNVSSQEFETKKNPSLDKFYYDFENRFRGPESVIRAKQLQYLPFFENKKLDFREELILDLGCGRGEWLTALKEHGYRAFGIDSNSVMIEECRKINLEVQEVDVFAYLSHMPDSSVGAITGFHIVEHLPFKVLIQLFDEVSRVLKPGGMAIFETPNPENLIVGSCNFYTDPTHLNPIPPHTLAFMLQQRGLSEIHVIRMTPMKDPLPSFDGPGLTEIAHWLYREQDYAVIATKGTVQDQA